MATTGRRARRHQVCPNEDKALLFHIVFYDAQGITVGSPLVFKGATIGDVTNVMLTSAQTSEPTAPCELDRVSAGTLDKSQVACVSVRIGEENRGLVRTDSEFRIRRSALVSIPDEKHIETAIWDSDSPERKS